MMSAPEVTRRRLLGAALSWPAAAAASAAAALWPEARAHAATVALPAQLPAARGATPAKATPSAPRLELSAYQRPSGALLTRADTASGIDPYFALKALWIGQLTGLDVAAPWQRFAGWMVDHQDDDGRWGRWRLDPTDPADPTVLTEHRWLLADADDALLATWLHSVATLGLPPELQVRHQAGLRQAASWLLGPLMDVDLGVYRITADTDVHLWMDNIEVWAAFRALAQARLTWSGPWAAAVPWQRRADALARAMRRVFMPAQADGALRSPLPRVSTQPGTQPTAVAEANFYPHTVAAPFAWLHGWTDPLDAPQPATPSSAANQAAMQAWCARHEADWVRRARTDYPWGLMAVAAWQHGQHDVARRWLQRAAPLRDGPQWNIVEEAAWQGLRHQLGATGHAPAA